MGTKSSIWLAAIVIGVLAGGCSADGSETSSRDGRDVSVVNIAFEPASTTIDSGTVITWTNEDEDVHHTVTSGTPGSDAVPGVSAGEPSRPDGMFDGGLADGGARFSFTFTDRRVLMSWVQLFRFVVVSGLGAVAVAEWDRLPLIYALAFLLGTAETLFDNSAQAMIPSLVARSRLERANSRLFASEITANEFAGPPLGGFLFILGAGLPFFFDAMTFGASGALVVSLRGDFAPVSHDDDVPTKIRHDIAEGLRWLLGHRLLRTLGIMVGVMNMFNTAALSVFVLFAYELLDLGPTGFGILMTGFALGSVPGSLLATWFSDRLGRGRVLFFTVLISGLAKLITGSTSSPIVVGIAFFFVGFTVMVWNIVTVSLRQAIVPNHLLSRVNSIYRLVAWGTMPLGAALGGVLSEGFGLRAPFYVGGVVIVAMSIVTLPIVNNAALEAARAEAL